MQSAFLRAIRRNHSVWNKAYKAVIKPSSPASFTFQPLRGLTQGSDFPDEITRLKSQLAEAEAARLTDKAARVAAEGKTAAAEAARVAAEAARVAAEAARVAAEDKAAAAEAASLATEKKAEAADAARLRSEGRAWALFEDLMENPIDICVGKAYQISNTGKFVQALRVPETDSREIPDQLRSRSNPIKFFKTDMFGSSKYRNHELAHIVPHSRSRAALWTSVLAGILNLQIESPKDESLFRKMIEGHYPSSHTDRRKEGSGLTHQPFNLIALAEQKTWWDENPSISIFPNLSLDSMIKWDGEDYSAIVVKSSPIVFQRIGAVNGNLFEWNGDDERVENSFKGFRDAASLLIALMKGPVKETHAITTDYLLCESMQQYLAKQTTFLAPFPNKSEAVKYRVVKFSAGKRFSDTPSSQGHPAPMPLLLIAKSLNGWFSHLLQQNKLKGFEFPKGVNDAKPFCAVFPICGVDESDASCPVCLAREIVRGNPALDHMHFSEEEYAHVQKIADYEEAVDEVGDDILLTRASDLIHQVVQSLKYRIEPRNELTVLCFCTGDAHGTFGSYECVASVNRCPRAQVVKVSSRCFNQSFLRIR